ncbi:MAG: hypothetical protein HKO57_05305, partial [Akkermansiaceae bacterium]|nr:hypothetical protein [Akkermansiaceae bacterium]
MIPRSYTAITLALAALSLGIGGEVAVAGPAKLRPTHDQLSKRRATGPEVTKGASNYVPADAADIKSKRPEPPSLIKRSTILSYGGFWTIVPKNAILHTPANFRSRISE